MVDQNAAYWWTIMQDIGLPYSYTISKSEIIGQEVIQYQSYRSSAKGKYAG